MHDISFLGQILAVMAVAVAVVYLSHKLRVPSVVGFLAAGVLVGPIGLGLLDDRADIELMAELGVALLLFTVGLEVSLKDMARLGRTVFGGGAAQVGLTLALAAGLLVLAGMSWRVALLLGALVALSSTAVVLKLVSERGETDSIHGRTLLGVLIFQDLAFVPFLLLVPVLSGAHAGGWGVLLVLGKAAAVIAGMALAAHFVFPWLMARVVASRKRELFTLTTLVIALGTAYVSGLAGLSLALGAFVAGMVLSETEFGHQALSDVLPVRDTLNSLFFISIGMLLDPAIVFAEPLVVAGLVAALVLLKTVVAGGVSLALGHSLRIALLVGFGLAQIGEFSFVLAQAGATAELLSPRLYQLFLAVSVLSMALTPAFVAFSYRLARGDEQFLDMGRSALLGPGRRQRRAAALAEDAGADHLSDHVIIVGYGMNGRNVARVLRKLGVRHVITELNARTVREARAAGEAAVFGDATRSLVLEHVGVARARAVVVTLPDAAAARHIVAQVSRLNPSAVVVVRTRYDAEVDRLHGLGADVVIPEEFETSLALAGAVMATYGASAHAIDRERKAIRDERYALLRQRGHEPLEGHGPSLTQILSTLDVRVVGLVGDAGAGAPLARSLRDLEVRARTGASVVAIVRGREVEANPGPDTVVQAGEYVVLMGRREQLDAAQSFLEAELRAKAVEALPPAEGDGNAAGAA